MHRFSWVGAWLVLTSLTATTNAQPARTPPPATPTAPPPSEPSSDDAAARLLFNTAREAFAAGNYETALSRFQQAYDLSHRSALLYNIGTTLDRMRRDREALAAFERFLVEDPTSPNRSEVEARVRVLREAVEAEDREAAEQQRQAEEQQRQLDEARRNAEAQRQSQATQDAGGGGTPKVLFFAVAGGAVATGALGLGFGIRTNGLNDDYRALGNARRAGGADAPSAEAVQDAYDSAHSSQTLTNVFLFTAAAATVAGVVLGITTDWDGSGSGSAEEEPATAVRVLPVAAVSRDQGYVGLQVGF